MNHPVISQERGALLLMGIAIIGFFTIGAASVHKDSLTIDETAHIVSGYLALHEGTFNVNLEHPPLVKMAAALPLMFMDTEYVHSREPAPDQWSEGHRFLFDQPGKVDSILWSSRLAVLLFNTILFCALAILAWKAFGNPWMAALLILFLAFDPNVLAHTRYVTTDVPIALSIVGLVLALLTYARQRPNTSIAWIVTFLTLALLVKFSGLVAFVLGIACFAVLSRGTINRLRNLLLVAFIPLACTYGLYFAVNLAVSPASLDVLASQADVRSATVETVNRSAFLRPVSSFFIGASAVVRRTDPDQGNSFTQFLDGEGKDRGGWRSYFPIATVYKETPAFFLLFLTVLIFLAVENEKRKLMLSMATVPLAFFGAYLLSSIASDLNIGIRHFLPVLCLVSLLCLLFLDSLMGMSSRHGRLLLGTFCTFLALLQGISVATTYPYFLSYFNAASGGWPRGYTHLVDSNLDWGEQLKRFSEWTYERNIPVVSVDYWGKSPLNLYDPENRLKLWSVANGRPNGYFAVNPMWITHSKWAKEHGKSKEDYSYLESMTPVKTFGGGLWVYDMDAPLSP